MREHLREREPDVATDDAILIRRAMAELPVLVAVRIAHVGEVPHPAGVDAAEVQRVLAGVEAERDDDIIPRAAAPQLPRRGVAAERDVTVAPRHLRRRGIP